MDKDLVSERPSIFFMIEIRAFFLLFARKATEAFFAIERPFDHQQEKE